MAKIKGQCLYDGLCLLAACGCRGTYSVTLDGFPHSSIFYNENGDGIFNGVNYCLSPSLEHLGQLLRSYWPNLVRKVQKLCCHLWSYLNWNKMEIASFCFTFFSYFIVFEDE